MALNIQNIKALIAADAIHWTDHVAKRLIKRHDSYLSIITAYQPDPDKWDETFTKRGLYNMTNCTFCKGDLHDALTTFTIDLDSCIVIIRNVPSQVCSQCEEPYYSTDVMRQLYKIAESVRNSMTEVAIVNYHPAA